MSKVIFEWLYKRKICCTTFSSFIDFYFPNHVYKLKKGLVWFKEAPKSWYDRLSKKFIDQNF